MKRVIVVGLVGAVACGGGYVPAKPAPAPVPIHVPASSDSHRASRGAVARCAASTSVVVTESTSTRYRLLCEDIVAAISSLPPNTLPAAPNVGLHVHLSELAASSGEVDCKLRITATHAGNYVGSASGGARVSVLAPPTGSRWRAQLIHDCNQAVIGDLLEKKLAPSLSQFAAQQPPAASPPPIPSPNPPAGPPQPTPMPSPTP